MDALPDAPRPRPYAWRSGRALAHIPGDDGWPIIGRTLSFLADQEGWGPRMLAAHGPVFRTSTFFERSVTLCDPDLADAVLKDRERIFSSEHGWHNLVSHFFPRGLMLRDFDVHRLHRGVLQEAFKRPALQGYLDRMNPRIASTLDGWADARPSPFYPRAKRLTLELAASVFTGVDDPAELDRFIQAFVDMMNGTFSLLRVPLPLTAYGRARRQRRWMADWFLARLRERRASEGSDLLSHLARAAGGELSDADVVDHMIFLMMAAHDTTTSALTHLAYELGRTPAWQERLRAAADALGRDTIGWEALARLDDVDRALKETLRLHPPVVAIPRYALRDTELGGYTIPAGTVVWLDVRLLHNDPKWWSDPRAFDPDRFSDERAEHRRHPAMWLPYSGGAHICLGMQFSVIQVKALLVQLLRRYRIELPAGYQRRGQLLPFPKPADDLPLRLVPR
ncbi:MAG TPA: cytochrome P450 [Myxococcota bacterium]|nr:cytochrome P450 [Myxococcota bacterium]